MPIIRTPEGAKKYGKPIGTQYGNDAPRNDALKERAVSRLQQGNGTTRAEIVRNLANGPVPSKLTPAQQVALYRERMEDRERAKQRNGARRTQTLVKKIQTRRKRSEADRKRIKRLLGIDVPE